jgi:hypothetical protein
MTLKVVAGGKVAAAAVMGSVIWVIIGFAPWRDIANGTRVGSPFTTNDYGQHLLFDGSVQTPAIIGVILLHICAAILGYVFVVRPIWGNRRLAAEVWLMLAGLVPGTLLLIALSRLISLFFPNPWAPGIIVALALAAALFGIIRVVGFRPRISSLTINWPAIWASVAVLITVFVFTVHIDRFHVVGEASVWFMNEVYLSDTYGIGTAGRFPLVSQHYDEAALLYPVIYGLMHIGPDASGTFTAIYWIMLALGRVGVGSILYIAMRSLGADRLSSLVILAFVCCASLSLNAISSRLLFDSLSPLAYALHVARFLIPVLPLLFVAAFGRWEGGASVGAITISTMLGIGLSSMPIHAILFLPWGFAVAALTAISPAAARSASVWRAASIVSLIVLIAFTFAYLSGGILSVPLRVGILLAASVTGAVIMLLAWFRSGVTLQFRVLRSAPFVVMLAISLGYAFGMLLLGNAFIPRTLGFLGHVWPWTDIGVADRLLRPIGISSWQLIQSPYCEEGYQWGFRTLTGHCGTLAVFIRTYGLAFVVMTSVIAWWSLDRPQNSLSPDRQLTMMLSGIVLCVLAMPISFIVFDFLSPLNSSIESQRTLSVWLRSRLVELWFYGGMLLALVLFVREASAQRRRWAQSLMMIAVAVFGLSPLVMPAQLIANFSYLFNAWLE